MRRISKFKPEGFRTLNQIVRNRLPYFETQLFRLFDDGGEIFSTVTFHILHGES